MMKYSGSSFTSWVDWLGLGGFVHFLWLDFSGLGLLGGFAVLAVAFWPAWRVSSFLSFLSFAFFLFYMLRFALLPVTHQHCQQQEVNKCILVDTKATATSQFDKLHSQKDDFHQNAKTDTSIKCKSNSSSKHNSSKSNPQGLKTTVTLLHVERCWVDDEVPRVCETNEWNWCLCCPSSKNL